ncbi:hypothetical protein [Bacillus solitudinis]|uniref:hypothetical protein n=1 Tax=Bacillus solitudinis TaxID=2014074 RepID=UPI000C23A034|nr:hypothetical protein [Bacillus solitudinis]
MDYRNRIAKTIFYIGIIEIIAGFILGFIFAQDGYAFVVSVFYSWTIGGFITGILFIGFAELIERQTETNMLLRQGFNISNKEFIAATTSAEVEIKDSDIQIKNKEDVSWDLESADISRIILHFRNKVINEIVATPFNYKFVVTVNGEDHLIRIDRGYSNHVLPLKFSTYPEVKEWLEDFKAQ